jgi:hypothetical protein
MTISVVKFDVSLDSLRKAIGLGNGFEKSNLLRSCLCG